MDNNSQNIPSAPAPVVSVPVVPQVPIQNATPTNTPVTPPNKSGKKKLWIFLIIVLIILIPALSLGYMYLNSQKSYNAGVYKESTSQQISSTPTPTQPEINSTDTSDAALEQDSQKLDQNLSNVDSDLENADQSLNDQQTNLQ